MGKKSTAVADATYVAPKPFIEKKPGKNIDFKFEKNIDLKKDFKNDFKKSTAVADATYVAPKPKKVKKETTYQPRMHYLKPADTSPFAEEQRRIAENKRKIQESFDIQCELEPLGARVNGMMSDPSGNWSKVSPGPLEFVALNSPVGSALTTALTVKDFIQDPTDPKNITGVGLTLLSKKGIPIPGLKGPAREIVATGADYTDKFLTAKDYAEKTDIRK
jgi:hypothetical protein